MRPFLTGAFAAMAFLGWVFGITHSHKISGMEKQIQQLREQVSQLQNQPK